MLQQDLLYKVQQCDAKVNDLTGTAEGLWWLNVRRAGYWKPNSNAQMVRRPPFPNSIPLNLLDPTYIQYSMISALLCVRPPQTVHRNSLPFNLCLIALGQPSKYCMMRCDGWRKSGQPLRVMHILYSILVGLCCVCLTLYTTIMHKKCYLVVEKVSEEFVAFSFWFRISNS